MFFPLVCVLLLAAYALGFWAGFNHYKLTRPIQKPKKYIRKIVRSKKLSKLSPAQLN